MILISKQSLLTAPNAAALERLLDSDYYSLTSAKYNAILF
jgi:hypothetical protein